RAPQGRVEPMAPPPDRHQAALHARGAQSLPPAGSVARRRPGAAPVPLPLQQGGVVLPSRRAALELAGECECLSGKAAQDGEWRGLLQQDGASGGPAACMGT
ncbi:MAG: hypothetical protein SGPRY_013577, partial [Prymnesium sp.]